MSNQIRHIKFERKRIDWRLCIESKAGKSFLESLGEILRQRNEDLGTKHFYIKPIKETNGN